ncbi:MAG: hypothetical protein IPI59_08655 [Sphingobacteriales bacterium]|jgi:hypothetical protein|nr:hypothetical protein [Sphingobacteriales bacterium]MBP9141902.1 hypothetical protein [Chitinophagales bacterium]MDA0198806.1 hypothetical protein [Bacteroidota bacterium]MBK6889878.1 hypothetical protein [Sphingobacteriales bacterium]MBK7527603.1 hypothetical protein [Sphingobacteriales bacterium]
MRKVSILNPAKYSFAVSSDPHGFIAAFLTFAATDNDTTLDEIIDSLQDEEIGFYMIDSFFVYRIEDQDDWDLLEPDEEQQAKLLNNPCMLQYETEGKFGDTNSVVLDLDELVDILKQTAQLALQIEDDFNEKIDDNDDEVNVLSGGKPDKV